MRSCLTLGPETSSLRSQLPREEPPVSAEIGRDSATRTTSRLVSYHLVVWERTFPSEAVARGAWLAALGVLVRFAIRPASCCMGASPSPSRTNQVGRGLEELEIPASS